MSKAIVNMTPDPSDIQTIHCSQGDTDAREWEFELHNNGEVIDAGGITEQMVFKSYEGGTEQILPENGAVPVTAPFVGDIKYPDATRTDQEFLYRQSPTEEDGLVKITDIKGNTLVWNQLVQEVSSTYWENGSSIASSSFANGECKFTASARYGYVALKGSVRFAIPTGHKVLMLVDVKAPVGSKFIVGYGSPGSVTSTGVAKNNVDGTGSYQTISILGTWSGTYANYPVLVMDTSTSNWSEIAFKNVMLFDLTAMFGSGNEPSTVEEFTSLFPLPYYDYCKGAMLSFGGRNVKFKQIVQNGNFADVSAWNRGTTNVSYTVSENVATVSTSADGNNYISQLYDGIVGHKYLFTVDYKTSYVGNIANLYYGLNNQRITVDSAGTNNWVTFANIVTAQQDPSTNLFQIRLQCRVASAPSQFRNCMLIDLTEMFGVGNEPSAEGFLELFADDFYEYTTGQYMNIGQPVSLKTTGKNQLNPSAFDYDTVYEYSDDGNLTVKASDPRAWTTLNTFHLKKGNYIFTRSVPNGVCDIRFGYENFATGHLIQNQVASYPFTVTQDTDVKIKVGYSYPSYPFTTNVMIRFADTDDTFEPYTSSALSIPLDEFPNGMDGINDAKDYRNETSYGKVIGEVDLGTLNWVQRTEVKASLFSLNNPFEYKRMLNVPSICSKYEYIGTVLGVSGDNGASGKLKDKQYALYYEPSNASKAIYVYDTDYTDATAFMNAMKGVKAKYEMSVPLENYGVIDLGSLEWSPMATGASSIYRMGSTVIDGIKKVSESSEIGNIECANYPTKSADSTYLRQTSIAVQRNGTVVVYDPNYNTLTSADAFKQAMQGIYLLYEKENPQGFTTATLVTENGEVALANENGVLVGKCNSDVSADAGFIEGKIKLSDEDGDVYSNKIQIHVERSPQ